MRNTLLSIALLAASALPLRAQLVWYVDQKATGSPQTGLSWASAFTDLQMALQIAHYGDEIWVAAGVYKPTATAQRNVAFILKRGVRLLGGFKGGESSASQRDPAANVARLSGDIGEIGVATDNSFHVLHGLGLDHNNLIDGFVISDGYSRGATNIETDKYGAGLFLLGADGLADSRPVISNCVFEHNQAGLGGGGAYVGAKVPTDPFAPDRLVNPQFRNCTFYSNRSDVNGGGLMKAGPTAPGDTFLLENCRFLDNYSFALFGAGIDFVMAGSSNVIIRSCSFERNYSQGGSGGGFYWALDGEGSYNVDIKLESCLFFKNSANEGAGFSIDGRFNSVPDIKVALQIKDCLFDENDSRSGEGSAYAISMNDNSNLHTVVKGCQFLNNVGGTYFAASIICYDQSEADVLVEDCEFINNRYKTNPYVYFAAFNAGGHKVHSRLNNCLFAHNTGGALFAGGPEDSQVLTEVTNCTFFNNGANPFGKRWHQSFSQAGAAYYNNMRFFNCAIWEPQSGHLLIRNHTSSGITGLGFFFDYCSLSPLLPGPIIIPNNNLVFGDSIYYGTYPAFVDTASGDFRLGHCSPAMGRGSNDKALEAGLALDYDGLPRIRFGRVDLGAYERQEACGQVSAQAPAGERVSLWPSPAGRGERVWLSLPPWASSGGSWELLDASGRSVGGGSFGVPAQGALELSAPAFAGAYWLSLRSGGRAAWGRLVVE